MGILGYSNNIIEKLNDNEAFDKGSNFELEIRGNSIWVVEQLLQRIKQLDPEYAINAILLDFFLWDYAKEIESTMKIPIHLTRSIYY